MISFLFQFATLPELDPPGQCLMEVDIAHLDWSPLHLFKFYCILFWCVYACERVWCSVEMHMHVWVHETTLEVSMFFPWEQVLY